MGGGAESRRGDSSGESMHGRWAGVVVLGPGWLRYEGPVLSADLHAHHAVQVIEATKPLSITAPDAGQIETTTAVIPADMAHGLVANGQGATLTYLEPDLVRVPREGGPREWSRMRTERRALGSPEHAVKALLRELGHRQPPAADALVSAAIEEVRRRLPDRVYLGEVATAVAMSRSRLSHRFTADQGIPLRRWVLWERLQLAGDAIAAGDDLTSAAHAAGFADSSHLHRTFRSMFGVAPSDVAGVVRWSVAR